VQSQEQVQLVDELELLAQGVQGVQVSQLVGGIGPKFNQASHLGQVVHVQPHLNHVIRQKDQSPREHPDLA